MAEPPAAGGGSAAEPPTLRRFLKSVNRKRKFFLKFNKVKAQLAQKLKKIDKEQSEN